MIILSFVGNFTIVSYNLALSYLLFNKNKNFLVILYNTIHICIEILGKCISFKKIKI